MEQAGRVLDLQPSFPGPYLHHFAIVNIRNNHFHKRKLFHHRTSLLHSYSTVFQLLVHKLALKHQEQEETNKAADHPRPVSGRFSEQGNLYTGLASSCCELSKSLHLPCRIFKVYTEALPGLSHMYLPDGLHGTLRPQGCVFELAPAMGTVG